MADDLSLVSVLLVEDSSFMRRLLRSVLFSIGIRRLHTAEGGEEAIEILKKVAADYKRDRVGEIDLVFCDYVMPGMDGVAVLDWVRRDQDSPDPFLPFVMMSARADNDVVAAARDHGASEFAAKPFSAASVAGRLLAVVNNPRSFVLTRSYFGPDRRRRQVAGFPQERRKRTDGDVEIFHDRRDPRRLDMVEGRVCHFRFKNRLKEKIAGGAPTASLGANLIEAAEAEIAQHKAGFDDQLREAVDRLTDCLAALREGGGQARLAEIREVAHELRGQGGVFGYMLVTGFAKSLFRAAADGVVLTPQRIDLIKAHIDAIRLVARQGMRGDGGAIGVELAQGLEDARRKQDSSDPA